MYLSATVYRDMDMDIHMWASETRSRSCHLGGNVC